MLQPASAQLDLALRWLRSIAVSKALCDEGAIEDRVVNAGLVVDQRPANPC